jgi:hypothetical protein
MVIGCPGTMKSFQLARLVAVEGGTDKVYSFHPRRRKRGLQFAEILNDIILYLKAMVGIVVETREMNHPLPGIRHSVVFVWIFSSQNQRDIIESGCGTRQVMPDEGQRKIETNARCALFLSSLNLGTSCTSTDMRIRVLDPCINGLQFFGSQDLC